MKEWVKYSAYGIPFGLPGGDANSSGATDATDTTQVQTWINGSIYDVRGDIDLNGTVDATDKSTIRSSFVGLTLGRALLSASGVNNRIGSFGASSGTLSTTRLFCRHRVLASELGRWLQRDPAGYLTHTSLYECESSSPVVQVDPTGLDGDPPLECGGPGSAPKAIHVPGCHVSTFKYGATSSAATAAAAQQAVANCTHQNEGFAVGHTTFSCPGCPAGGYGCDLSAKELGGQATQPYCPVLCDPAVQVNPTTWLGHCTKNCPGSYKYFSFSCSDCIYPL